MQVTISDKSNGPAEFGGAWLYLDEVMHRTLNDYTVLLAMVQCASLAVSDTATEYVLRQIELRLRATSTTFRALGRPWGTLPRSLDVELESLCAALTESVLKDREIALTLSAQPITVDSGLCWRLSLVIAELVMNAAKHAFRASRRGSIEIDVRMSGGGVQCMVRDNGAATAVISPGRGTTIVNALISELGASIVRNFSSRGSIIVLHVPLPA